MWIEESEVEESRAVLVAKLAATILSAPAGSYAHDAMSGPGYVTIRQSVVQLARELLDEAYKQCPVMVEGTTVSTTVPAADFVYGESR